VATSKTDELSRGWANVAQPGLDEKSQLTDLTVVRSLQGGGGLDDVDLAYVPVPQSTTLVLVLPGLFGVVAASRRR
jgi:hypothetical protein